MSLLQQQQENIRKRDEYIREQQAIWTAEHQADGTKQADERYVIHRWLEGKARLVRNYKTYCLQTVASIQDCVRQRGEHHDNYVIIDYVRNGQTDANFALPESLGYDQIAAHVKTHKFEVPIAQPDHLLDGFMVKLLVAWQSQSHGYRDNHLYLVLGLPDTDNRRFLPHDPQSHNPDLAEDECCVIL